MRPRTVKTYDELLEALPIDPDGIIAFRFPKTLQRRASSLTTRNSAGKLTQSEQLELQQLLALESAMRVLKAKALQAKSQKHEPHCR